MAGCIAEHRCTDEEVKKETKERMEKFLKREKELTEVEAISKPLVEWFKNNKCPHDMIIITDDGVHIMSGESFFPTRELKEENTEAKEHTASDNKEKEVSEIIEEYYESCARTLTELSKNPANLVKYIEFINCITESLNKSKETLPMHYRMERNLY